MLKNVISYISIFCVCIYCTPKKHRLFSKDFPHKSIIENEKLNILYRGIKNYLTIYVPEADSIQVKGTGVFKEKKNEYYITPFTGTSLEITISSFTKGKVRTEKREFRILNIGSPFASINNKTGKIILSKEELATSKIEYYIPQFVIDLGKVRKFRYQINHEEPLINYGNKFNDSVKEKIYRMKSGDIMIIDLNFDLELETVDLKKITELEVHIE